MKKIMIILLIGFFIFSQIGVFALPMHNNLQFYNNLESYNTSLDGPQEEWNKTYGGENRDWLSFGLELDDTSIIVRGCRDFSQSNRGGDGWLAIIDNEGNLIWENTFGGDDSDFCNGLLQTFDNGYKFIWFGIL
jgi:hypothetical protein